MKQAKARGKPVRIANGADVQGRRVIAGKGLELIITLGTGVGAGLYLAGRLAPHLELAHHPFRKGETYDEQLGNATRKRVGNGKWNLEFMENDGASRNLVGVIWPAHWTWSNRFHPPVIRMPERATRPVGERAFGEQFGQ